MAEQLSGCTDETGFDEASWRKTLAASTLAQFVSMVGFSFVMPFLPDYIQKLGAADQKSQLEWAGLAAAAPSWTMFVFAPIWGAIADRVGRKIMVMRAMFGAAALIALMGFATSPLVLFTLRLCQGAITGTVSATNALVSSVTPSKRASFSLGIMQAAVHAGHLVGPLVGGYSADVLGYRYTFVIGGACALVGGLLVLFFAHEGPPPISPHPAKRNGYNHGLIEVLKVTGFSALIGIVFIGAFARMVLNPVFLPYVKTLITDHSRDKTITGGLISVTAALTMVTAVWSGRLSDRYGAKLFLIAGTVLGGIFCIPQAFVPDVSSLLVLRVLIGIGMGMVAPATAGLVNRLVPRSSQGKAFGLVQSATSLGLGLAPVAGGYMAAHLGFTWSFVMTGLVQILVGATAWLLLRKVGLAPSPSAPRA